MCGAVPPIDTCRHSVMLNKEQLAGDALWPHIFGTVVDQVNRLLTISCRGFKIIHRKVDPKGTFKKR